MLIDKWVYFFLFLILPQRFPYAVKFILNYTSWISNRTKNLAVIQKITIQVQGISSNLFICFGGLLKKEELFFQVCLSEVISKEYFFMAYKYLKSNQNADSAIIYALKVCYDYEKIKHELRPEIFCLWRSYGNFSETVRIIPFTKWQSFLFNLICILQK